MVDGADTFATTTSGPNRGCAKAAGALRRPVNAAWPSAAASIKGVRDENPQGQDSALARCTTARPVRGRQMENTQRSQNDNEREKPSVNKKKTHKETRRPPEKTG